MRRSSGALVLVSSLMVASQLSAADVREDIAKLIPKASAMKQADFEKLARGTVAPNEKAVEEKSLTLMLLTLDPTDASDAQREEFRYLQSKLPKPATIAREIYRVAFRLGGRVVLKGPVTFLHGDRITEVTANVEGGTATGHVTFKAPKLFMGKVQYTAVQRDGRWRITEWRLPAYGIHLVRDAEDHWTKR